MMPTCAELRGLKQEQSSSLKTLKPLIYKGIGKLNWLRG